MALSDKQFEEMRKHEEFVRKAVETAEDKADDFWSNLVNSSTDQMAGVARQAREKFTDWANRRKTWVHAGHNADGRVYSLKDWLTYGNEIASLATATTRDFNAYSTENAVEYTAAKSVEQVEAVAKEVKETVQEVGRTVTRPWFLYGAGGLLGLLALGYGLRPVAQLVGKARET
ncbi:hypothetical protein F0U59_26730 [Archangium gephyra]|nr:hypothetical protein F0U59_26730 [Archangium gephyra]